MTKVNTQYDYLITDTVKYDGDIMIFATSRDDMIHMRLYNYVYTEYTYKSMYVDINGAVDGQSSAWRLPTAMRNKIYSTRDQKIIIRDITDFTEYYNDPNDID